MTTKIVVALDDPAIASDFWFHPVAASVYSVAGYSSVLLGSAGSLYVRIAEMLLYGSAGAGGWSGVVTIDVTGLADAFGVAIAFAPLADAFGAAV